MSLRRPTNRSKSSHNDDTSCVKRKFKSKRVDVSDSDDDDDMYEMVDEQTYEERQRKLKEEGDFVVDDDGTGYVDYGDDDDECYSDDATKSGKKGKKLAQVDKSNQNITNIFSKMASKKAKPQVETVNKLERAAERELNDSGLNSFIDNLVKSTGKPTKKKDKRKSFSDMVSPPVKRRGRFEDVASSHRQHVEEHHDTPDDMDVGDYEDQQPSAAAEEDTPTKTEETPKMDIREQIMAAARSRPIAIPQVKAEPITPPVAASQHVTFMATPTAPNKFDVVQECGVDGSGWMEDNSNSTSQDTASSETKIMASGKTPKIIKNADGTTSLDMFWLDIYEPREGGRIYLIGKVWCDETNKYESCTVEIANMPRVLYFLPRQTKLGTNEMVEFSDVLSEVSEILNGVLPLSKDTGRSFRCKPKVLKYAFELPDVPRQETKYLEVQYPLGSEKQRISSTLSGKTFSRVFGTQQSATEQFILSADLMGPSWVRIDNIHFPEKSDSWCKFFGIVDFPKQVKPLINVLTANATDGKVELPDPPKLSMMSLSIKTIVDPRTHEHEIVAISGLFRDNVDVVGATVKFDSPSQVQPFSIIRGGKGCYNMPTHFSELIKQKKDKRIMIQSNERALLNYFLVQMQKFDPDVLLGHNIRLFDMDVLLTRMRAHNFNMVWSKLGRLRLSANAIPQKKLDGGFYGSTNFTPGRLLLDTYATAKELLLGQRNYSLTELVRTQLGKSRTEIQPVHVAHFFSSAEELLKLIHYSQADAWLVLQLAFKLEAIPVTLQLTNLGGNLWSRTLSGGRSERIEYLLLHEFYRQGYLLPDKETAASKREHAQAQGSDEQHPQDGGHKRGKPKYDGGLVLDPKAGLYDKYILLLDFNSLYPSIIQEYNICYTTVERSFGSEETMPPLPDLAQHKEMAVLPSLIRTLVQRRRQVRQILKSETDQSKRDQLEVRQKALKLTANSMYGCLGFNGFRFFARPVAALVTSQGRSILQNTVELTQQNLGYEVVYGDTDSIMVNTNTLDLNTVKQIGQRIKKEINKSYKLLEIEQDGIFKTLLLLKKKKYAALSVVNETPEGEVITTKETKGLDLVRRDWCALSKRVGHAVLDHILSGKSYDDIVDGIHDYLEEVGQEIRGGSVNLEEFVITKGLNKSPKDYPDAKSQPHLQVALAMLEEGKPVNTGDHIPYVICRETRDEFKKRRLTEDTKEEVEEDEESKKANKSSSYSDRAFHPNEIRSHPSILHIDIDWYLKQQIVPPTQRLIEPIRGTSALQVAQHLGLSVSEYEANASRDAQDPLTNIVDLSDEERYKQCDRVKLQCLSCQQDYEFPGIIAMPSTTFHETISQQAPSKFSTMHGLQCPACRAPTDIAYLSNILRNACRKAVETYYHGWNVPDDPSVELKTRQQSILGKFFILHGRRMQLQEEYPASSLFNQLKYIISLVNYDRNIYNFDRENRYRKEHEKYQLVEKPHVSRLDAVAHIHDKLHSEFLQNSAYNWIQPSIFSCNFKRQ